MYSAFNRNNPINLRILNRGTYCILHSSKIGKSLSHLFYKITRVCVTLIEATLKKNIHVDFTCSWKCVELLQVVPTMWNTKIQVPPLSESCCSQLSGFANTPSKALTCSVASLEGKNILVSCHDWLLAAINCVIAWASQTPEVPIVSYLIIFTYIERVTDGVRIVFSC